MKKILLVEDDWEIARLVSMFLESEKFQVVHVNNGKNALSEVIKEKPDLLILDIMLPGMNGIDICKQVRAFFSTPILMLTASDNDVTEVVALNFGADDYLEKPVSPEKLLARINSLLRRTAHTVYNGESVPAPDNLRIDTLRREVYLQGQAVALTTAEYDLLALLASSPGEIISREECYRQLRGIEYDGLDRSIDMRISSIRKKLVCTDSKSSLIKTVRGKGYMLVFTQ
ncbi:MAG: response regulator transcription factor [Amphritea sp.]|nr:response regulator transcription factor [Amphritea sp.]